MRGQVVKWIQDDDRTPQNYDPTEEEVRTRSKRARSNKSNSRSKEKFPF